MIEFAVRSKPTRKDAEMTIKTVLLAGAVALIPLAAQAQWKETVSTDRITGETLWAGIQSTATLADMPRPDLFSFIGGQIILMCERAVYFGLGISGKALGDRVEFSDLDELRIRARVDDRVAEFQAENWRNEDARMLVFRGAENDGLYSAIVNSGKLLLEIPTVEYGEIYFSFDLAGTRKLHDRVCGTEQAD